MLSFKFVTHGILSFVLIAFMNKAHPMVVNLFVKVENVIFSSRTNSVYCENEKVVYCVKTIERVKFPFRPNFYVWVKKIQTTHKSGTFTTLNHNSSSWFVTEVQHSMKYVFLYLFRMRCLICESQDFAYWSSLIFE